MHLIAEAADEYSLSRGITGLQVRIARAINTLARRRGQVFGGRYHAHVLKTPREVRNGLAYVLLNARRHAYQRGIVLSSKQLDPCSSGAYFDGWRNEHSVAKDPAPPVARARTWLLRVGWQRHGLISPAEIPACDSNAA